MRPSHVARGTNVKGRQCVTAGPSVIVESP